MKSQDGYMQELNFIGGDIRKFLAEWAENPISFGGDKYSSEPGLNIRYRGYTKGTVFELEFMPKQRDNLIYYRRFFERLVPQADVVQIDFTLLKHNTNVAKGSLYVMEDRSWGGLKGEWLNDAPCTGEWKLETRLITKSEMA